MSSVRFGVIGLGKHGTRYANHLSAGDAAGCGLTAVCRRNAAAGEAYAKEHGCQFFADADALVASDGVDAVVIATPPLDHPAIAQAAAAAGKHVLVEKPMARTVAECQAIIDACAAAGVKLMVGQTLRYNALLIAMRGLIPDMGRVAHMTLCQRQEPSTLPWHHSPEAAGGGNLLENGVHLLDAACWLTGQEVLSVYCETAHLAGEPTEDQFVAVLDLTGGVACTIDACKFGASRFGQVQVVAEQGQLIGSFAGDSLVRIKGRDAEALDTPEPIMGLPRALEDFAKAICNDTTPPIPGEDGRRAVAIAQACYRSAQERRPVEVA